MMTDGLRIWQGVVLSSIILLLAIQPSDARHHHHKLHGQQCRTAMSTLPAHFSYNDTAKPAAPTNSTAPPAGPIQRFIAVTGIPWQSDGEPIKSTDELAQHAFVVALPVNQTTVPDAAPPGNLNGTLCMDAGVLYSCSKCDSILYGKECYKKIGHEELETVSAGKVACTRWYSRTGYAVGGAVTMCGAESGDVYQCSSDEDLTECEPCVELGITSQP